MHRNYGLDGAASAIDSRVLIKFTATECATSEKINKKTKCEKSIFRFAMRKSFGLLSFPLFFLFFLLHSKTSSGYWTFLHRGKKWRSRERQRSMDRQHWMEVNREITKKTLMEEKKVKLARFRKTNILDTLTLNQRTLLTIALAASFVFVASEYAQMRVCLGHKFRNYFILSANQKA